MKPSLNKDTLSYQLGARPGTLFRDMSEVPLGSVIDSMNGYFSVSNIYVGNQDVNGTKEGHYGHPERDALVFYMMNHAVSVVRQRKHVFEPLGEYREILEVYHRELALRSTRMFYYLLLICTRESRHEKKSYSDPMWSKFKTLYGDSIVNFHKSIKGSGSDEAALALRNSAPNCALGTYTSFLSQVFHQGSYSSSYGGKAWAAVADVLRDFAHGKLTAEMMMDTAFTLCHNNGPIFNKGMLFEGYSHFIYKILDVQRSGQIPNMIAEKATAWANDSTVQMIAQVCAKSLPEVFSGYVNWFLVEELGALKSCKAEQQTQIQKYGYPSKFKAKVEAEKLKQEVAAQHKVEEMKEFLFIMPGIKVKKVKVRP